MSRSPPEGETDILPYITPTISRKSPAFFYEKGGLKNLQEEKRRKEREKEER